MFLPLLITQAEIQSCKNTYVSGNTCVRASFMYLGGDKDRRIEKNVEGRD